MVDLQKPIFSQVTTELPREPVAVPAPSGPPTVMPLKPSPSKAKFVWLALASLVVVVLAIWVAFGRQRAGTESSFGSAPRTAKVERRDFVRALRLTGTVHAVQSYSIAAPRLMGAQVWQLTITKMVLPGTKVKKGDLLVEFDPQDQIKNSMDRKADYISLVDQIQKKKADQATGLAQDQTALKQAEDALLIAQLEVRKNEVISRIDAEKNKENQE